MIGKCSDCASKTAITRSHHALLSPWRRSLPARSSGEITRVELSSPAMTMVSSGTPPEEPGALLEKVSLFSEICPWWFACFVWFCILDRLWSRYYITNPLWMRTAWCWGPCFQTFEGACRVLWGLPLSPSPCISSGVLVLLWSPSLLPLLQPCGPVAIPAVPQLHRTPLPEVPHTVPTHTLLKLFAISLAAAFGVVTLHGSDVTS